MVRRDRTPGSCGGPRALRGGLGCGEGAPTPGVGRRQQPSPRLRLPRDATPEGPWAAPAAPLGQAHPRAPASPAGARAPGEGRPEELRRGATDASLGKSRSQPSPAFRPAPGGRGRRPPLAPLLPPAIGSPLFSADRSPGKGEGVPRSILKGPSPLLVSRQVASTSGVGRAHGPPPPSSPQLSSGAAGRASGPGARAALLPSAFFSHPGLPGHGGAGTRGTGTPPSSGAVGGADPRQDERPHWSQAQGLGRSWERRGLARCGRQQQAGARPPG